MKPSDLKVSMLKRPSVCQCGTLSVLEVYWKLIIGLNQKKKKKHLCESEYTFQIFISSQSHTNSLLQSHIKGRVVGLKCGWVAESLSSMNEAVGSISALQKLKENSSLKYDYNRDRNNQIIISQNKLTSYTRTDNRDTHDDWGSREILSYTENL